MARENVFCPKKKNQIYVGRLVLEAVGMLGAYGNAWSLPAMLVCYHGLCNLVNRFDGFSDDL